MVRLSDLPSLAVRRPTLIVVLNLLIVIAGLGALLGVEVRELPDVDRPVVTVRAFFDAAIDRYPVDRDKIVMAGFSQGGFMAYLLALREPERFAGLLALSSWLPSELVRGIARRPAHERLPALVVHGSEDPMISIERAYASRDALLALGVRPSDLTLVRDA